MRRMCACWWCSLLTESVFVQMPFQPLYTMHIHPEWHAHTNKRNDNTHKKLTLFVLRSVRESSAGANASTNHILRHEVVIWMQQRTFLMTYLQSSIAQKKKHETYSDQPGHVCVCVCWPKRIPCKPLQFYSTHLNVFEPQVGSRLTSSLHFTNESNTILVSCRLVFSFVVIFMAFHINTHVENCLWYVPCAAAPCFKFKETLCRSVCLDILYILTNRNFVFISLFT